MTILKLILGGVVAVASAFGITVTVLFAILVAETSRKATGVGAVAGGFTMILHSLWFWLAVLVIFSVGFFLAYRKLYLLGRGPTPP